MRVDGDDIDRLAAAFRLHSLPYVSFRNPPVRRPPAAAMPAAADIAPVPAAHAAPAGAAPTRSDDAMLSPMPGMARPGPGPLSPGFRTPLVPPAAWPALPAAEGPTFPLIAAALALPVPPHGGRTAPLAVPAWGVLPIVQPPAQSLPGGPGPLAQRQIPAPPQPATPVVPAGTANAAFPLLGAALQGGVRT